MKTLVTYELINPSDPYTFKAPNLEVAGAAVVLLSTSYGAEQVDPKPEPGSDCSTPVLFGWQKWLDARGINDTWVVEHAKEIADALDSFLIGKPSERKDVESMLAMLTKKQQEKWRAERQDRHRTSMSQIGETAYQTAANLRNLAKKKPTPEKTK